MSLASIPRYLGPRPLPRIRPTAAHVGIRFLVLKIKTPEEDSVIVIRAADRNHNHLQVVDTFAQEIAHYKNTLHYSCDIVGGGRLNAAGSELDVYDLSTHYASWEPFLEEVLQALRDAMSRWELEYRKLKPWPQCMLSRFDDLQAEYTKRSAREMPGCPTIPR